MDLYGFAGSAVLRRGQRLEGLPHILIVRNRNALERASRLKAAHGEVQCLLGRLIPARPWPRRVRRAKFVPKLLLFFCQSHSLPHLKEAPFRAHANAALSRHLLPQIVLPWSVG